jgi:hypothetical protein
VKQLRPVLLLALAACGSTGQRHGRMPASGTMMAGDSMTMMAEPLIAPAVALLDSLGSGDGGVLSRYTTALPPLLKAIETDLMHLGMHRDSAYEALVDSVRRDASSPASAEAAARFRRVLSGYTAMVAKGRRG